MSRYRRASIPNASYFFTVVAYRRRPIFIDAWVLLPDHLHCIWTLPEGDADFSTRWMMIKRLVSLACKEDYHRVDWMTASKRKHGESTIWQRRFWEHRIRNEDDFIRHADYIHFNPADRVGTKDRAHPTRLTARWTCSTCAPLQP